MPRPRSADPKVAVTIRLPGSVFRAWEASAAKKGRTVRQHIEAKLIIAAGEEPPADGPAENEPEAVVEDES